MFQIDTDTAVAVRPATGAPGVQGWFTRGNPGPGTPVPPTQFDPDWCNHQQGELLSILAAAGIAPDKTKFDQVLGAIKQLIQRGDGSYIADTGAANALVIAPLSAPAAYVGGEGWRIVPANANTGAATLNRNGIGAKAIVRSDGVALSAGDIPASGLISVVYQAALDKFVLVTTATKYSNAASGYFRIPGTPLLVQWASYSLTPNQTTNCPSGSAWGTVPVTWPIAFPNVSYLAWVAPNITNNGQYTFAATAARSQTGVDVYHNIWASATVPVTGLVLSIGS
jgi:hypothetical protein